MIRHVLKGLIAGHLILSFMCLFPYHAVGGDTNIRSSILAGTWYPRSGDVLSKTVRDLLSGIKPPCVDGALKAIIVPHAGYMYSGRVAAHSYKLLVNRPFKRIIMVGPSHRMSFSGVSVNLQAGYETPLGVVPVDQKLAKKILDAGTDIRWIKQAHANEHSLEIQLPLLQSVLQDFQIVPILMGRQDFKTCSDLADTLVRAIGDREDTLLLASSDLSHYHSYSRAKELDLQFIKHVQGLDPQGLSKDLSAGGCEACGGGPVLTIMLAAMKMGANQAMILNHANSGDVTGVRSQVVGYLSAALVKSSDTDQHPR